ncbi:hypothetical protein ACT4YX_10555 [Acinetobacter baumannii]
MKTIDKAKLVIESLKDKSSVQEVKKQICNEDNADWDRVSKKAYDLYLQEARKQRKVDEKTRHVIATPLEEINDLIQLNNNLVQYALSLPSTVTGADVSNIQKLISDMPANEHKIIDAFASIIMNPRMRALQKKGRFEHFPPFKSFVHIIESAVISYYRGNFIGSYLTLIPVVEGGDVKVAWLFRNG